MSSLLQQRLLLASRTPVTQFQRFRGKINIQRPRQPHYDRALVNAVTQPQYPEPEKKLTCFQPRLINEHAQLQNPYNEIIAREVRNWLQQSRMVGIFHINAITADEIFRIRVELHKQNMHLKSYGKKIIESAVNGTGFEAILPLFDAGHHYLVFSSEQRVAQLLRLTRKTPQLILLAGIVDDTLLSRNEFVAYAQLPALPLAQAELAQTLNMAAGHVVQQLEAHQKNLVTILDVYAKGEGENTDTTAPTTLTETDSVPANEPDK